jgi:hypothetical protein
MPIYHIIGNITTDASDVVTSVESINGVSSSVILYKGVYHVFHQCCQNHWDHVVSTDLIHWIRLPPPVAPNMNPTGIAHQDWYDAPRAMRTAVGMAPCRFQMNGMGSPSQWL